MTTALLARLDSFGSAATLEVYGGVRPAPGQVGGTLMAAFTLARPAGTVDAAGVLALAPAPLAALTQDAGPARWARLRDGMGAWLLDLTARMGTDADEPGDPAQVVVYLTPSTAGALVRFAAGTIAF